MGLKDENIGQLEELAKKRRERLLALKKKKASSQQDESKSTSEPLPETQVLFRNYQPKSKNLQDSVVPNAELGNVDELVADQLKKEFTEDEIGEVDINNLAPRKVAFDLRRGIQAKLDKADRETDKAIVELIRERVKEGRTQDLFLAVRSGAKVQQKPGFDSDED